MYPRRRYGAWVESMRPRKSPVSPNQTRLMSRWRSECRIHARHLFLTVKEDGPTGQSAEAGISSETTGKAWPEAFISDFGSRQWMTYRSNFTPIPRAKSPEAASSMTLSVRLRSQLMDSQGFTSDTGWGCMIRSGQSLLANTFAILLLGRGE
jgi:hypothetical protein